MKITLVEARKKMCDKCETTRMTRDGIKMICCASVMRKCIDSFLDKQQDSINEKIERETIFRPNYEDVHKEIREFCEEIIENIQGDSAVKANASNIAGVACRAVGIKPSGCPHMEGGEG